jgi:hypothetical protein
MATEEEKKRMADFIASSNKKKAEKSKANTEHIKHLKGLSSLEEVLVYWSENCEDSNLLRGVFGDNTSYEITDHFYGVEVLNKILKAEMLRIENKHLDDLPSTHIKNRFEHRIKSNPSTFKIAKKKALETIDSHIGKGIIKHNYSKLRGRGFRVYGGGDNYQIAAQDLRLLTIGIEDKINFKTIYEGYLLAKLRDEIKNYKHKMVNSFLSELKDLPKASPPHPINDRTGIDYRPKLELKELLILFYGLRDQKIIGSGNNVTLKHLALSIHLLTGYSYTTLYKELKGKKDVNDFSLNDVKRADLIETLKKFIEDLKGKL